MRRLLLTSCALGPILALGLGPASAETLTEALASAYATNPQILAERANVRATDENVPQALAGWRPTVQFTGSQGLGYYSQTASSSLAHGRNVIHPSTVDLNITQPIYQGGRTVAQTDQAEALVQAERARLVATEESVLFAASQSFLDVVRDQATVQLNINNEQVLRRQLEATNDQFRVGEVTRTDVAQAEARLALAISQRIQAENNLETSRANFQRNVGHYPDKLEQPKERPVLPANRDEAIAAAYGNNANVIAATYNEKAAQFAVTATRAQLLPSLSLVGDVNHIYEQTYDHFFTNEASIIARVTVPLYEGGSVYSQTRQAVQVVGQRRNQLDDARRAAVQVATTDWDTIVSITALIKSDQETIRAATIALEGVRQEASVGSRTVLDVLNQEQELFTDQVALVQAQHDLAVAQFDLGQQIGRLTAIDLKLPVEIYDVERYYKGVRDKWIGFSPKQ